MNIYSGRNSEWYIEPDKAYVELMCEHELLLKKLMRYDNYRRIICNRKPGPEKHEKEIHQWYRQYQEESQGPQSATQERAEDAGEDAEQSSTAKWKEYLQEHLQDDLKKASTERSKTSDQEYQQDIYSFDSEEIHSEESVAADADYTKSTNSNTQAPDREGTNGSLTPTIATNPTNFPGFTSKKSGAKQATDETGKGGRTDLESAVQSAQKAISVLQGRGTSRGSAKMAPARPNPLISRFVREMSPILRDGNPQGSITRSLRAVEQYTLSQKDVFACLVKAYVVARDTKKVREQYRRPGGDLRMPLFCTMFERFARDCATDHFHYDDDSLAQAIAADECLTLFVAELKPEEMVLLTVAQDQIHDDNNDSDQQLSATTSAPEQEDVSPANVEPGASDQQQEEQEYINTDDPAHGWMRATALRHANHLHDFVGRNRYQCVVLPTRCRGRYGFIIVERETGNEWVYVTMEGIEDCMRQ